MTQENDGVTPVMKNALKAVAISIYRDEYEVESAAIYQKTPGRILIDITYKR